MATKKKTKKKSAKSKKAATPKKKQTKKRAVKRAAPKKSAKKTAAPNKAAAKKIDVKKSAPGKPSAASARGTEKVSRGRRASVSREMLGPGSGGQSGDLQGLSNVEAADSESVDELVEEGNAFEAGIVTGVEDAGRHRTKEVTTREVPEDDVPDEYLDQD
jgi:hypothetical protein